MKSIKIISVVFLLLVMSSVQAHGPTRQTSVLTTIVDASADEVWAVIQNFDDLSWHPLVVSIEQVQGGNKKKATRTLVLETGGQAIQELKKYDAKKMWMKFKTPSDDMSILRTVEFKDQQHPIRAFPAENYLDQIKVERLGENKSTLAWKSSFFRSYTNNLVPGELPELNEDAAKAAIQGFVNAGLIAIMKKFNQNATAESIENCFSTNPNDCEF
jgi:mxaD protein